jgi:hypothetical protein
MIDPVPQDLIRRVIDLQYQRRKRTALLFHRLPSGQAGQLHPAVALHLDTRVDAVHFDIGGLDRIVLAVLLIFQGAFGGISAPGLMIINSASDERNGLEFIFLSLNLSGKGKVGRGNRAERGALVAI